MGDSSNFKSISGRGGVRPGAGRPKGSMEAHTIAKMKAKEKFMERVSKVADKLFNAQYNKAVGESHLFVKRTIGQGTKQRVETEIVTDPQTIIDYINGELDDSDGTEYYYISTKPADNQAIQGLLDRGWGKAKESVENTGDQTLTIVTRHAGSQDKDADD